MTCTTGSARCSPASPQPRRRPGAVRERPGEGARTPGHGTRGLGRGHLRPARAGLRTEAAALDELGLAGSLRLHLASLVEDSPLEVTLDADEQLALPAAVEVAVYRSASEAVTNVIRHSTARRCRVAVATSGPDLVLTVDDDGHVSDTWHAGVGLTSMRERAVELGGTFVASSGPSGFHIKVTYPRK